MSSGHLPTRRLIVALAFTAVGFAGCGRNQYDPYMSYPVRTDFIVGPGTWEFSPTEFNRPGLLPLDQLKLPKRDRSADADKLEETLGKKVFDPANISQSDRADYAQVLEDMFGTPAKPKVSGFDPAALKALDDTLTDDAIVKTLKIDPATLAEGSMHYRLHCLHCHGLEGNGRGPTGPWLNPSPRDYRQGIFKFTSSTQDQNARKPRREDLLHILNFGIEGTSMPSFNILSDEEKDKLASYVIHLSIRGEVEYRTMFDQLKLAAESKGAEGGGKSKFVTVVREDLKDAKLKDAMADNLALCVTRWLGAQKPDAAIVPAPYTYANTDDVFLESAARGGKIFLGTGGCISCHQNFGRESNLTYDAWGTIVRGRNVYDGVYRGGRRPIDLYNRIFGGIDGAGMAAYKDIKNLINPQDLGMKPEDFAKTEPLWDIVNFLRALPYRPLREKLKAEPFNLKLAD
jgi:mono/diheme cytochrome c family protein